MALSVRPGRNFAIWAHRLPSWLCLSMIIRFCGQLAGQGAQDVGRTHKRSEGHTLKHLY